MEEREHLGRVRKEAMIPKAAAGEIGPGYNTFITQVKEAIGKTRVRTVIHANEEMILLYWKIGRAISMKQKKEGWGARVIDKMSHDIREAFPDMKGFSPRNLKYMRKFAEAWPDPSIVQQVVAQLPWRANCQLLDKVENSEKRLWYAEKTIENGWSSSVLSMEIEGKLFERDGKAINNFTANLPPADSDMAAQIFKDPYLFDFLGTDMPRREVEIERKLTEHIQNFLLELGQGFAFVGRQVHLEVGDQDFYIDLLFYHLKLRCFIVIELKACDFEPSFIGQLTMYQNVVDDLLRQPGDKKTIGLLLVKGKNETVVKYSIAGYQNPIGVAEWKNQLSEALRADLQDSLPTIEEIEREVKESG